MSAVPISIRLCDDDGMVSDTPVEPGSHGAEFNPGLTYLRLANNLRAHTGHPPVEAFHCTGSMHAAGEIFYCTSPAHSSACGEWVHPAPTQRCSLPSGHHGLHEPDGGSRDR